MYPKVILFDLEKNVPTAQFFREILEHYSVIYLFNCSGKFEYNLEDLTEFSSWMSSGQITILETPKIAQKEYEYAMLVGQLLALLEPTTHVEVISAMESSLMLVSMLQESNISSHLIQTDILSEKRSAKIKIPNVEKIINSPDLRHVKQYCDTLIHMKGKPNTLEKLKNSIGNILKLDAREVQKIVGMLINLRIIKKLDQQIIIRKKVLKQWQELDLTHPKQLDNKTPYFSIHESLKIQSHNSEKIVQQNDHDDALLKNFALIDPVQMEVIKKLHSLKSEKPKDIYALRDLLEQMFPKSDVRLLLKELIEKGYIYWNGHEILYSHEMFLN